MAVVLINPLNKQLQALRTLQCPDHIQPNDSGTAYRVSSGAFIPGSDGTISVDLEESLQRDGLSTISRYGTLPRSVALVGHSVEGYESQGYAVAHAPVDGNNHHGSVTTTKKNNPLRKAARAMADQASFIVPIDPKAAAAMGARPLTGSAN